MDMLKFTSLIVNEALYFACPSQFQDPYEGYYPQSHIEAFESLNKPILNDLTELGQSLKQQGKDTSALDNALQEFPKQVKEAIRESSQLFGINCWHKSEYESDAMWKLYSALNQGIAIESSISQLKNSVTTKITMDSVRYSDFESVLIEKGHKHYGLFQKRQAFEHEKEIRAITLLQEPGKGMLIKCCLETLITCVYISPSLDPYVKADVESLLQKLNIDKPVKHSTLLSPPSY